MSFEEVRLRINRLAADRHARVLDAAEAARARSEAMVAKKKSDTARSASEATVAKNMSVGQRKATRKKAKPKKTRPPTQWDAYVRQVNMLLKDIPVEEKRGVNHLRLASKLRELGIETPTLKDVQDAIHPPSHKEEPTSKKETPTLKDVELESEEETPRKKTLKQRIQSLFRPKYKML